MTGKLFRDGYAASLELNALPPGTPAYQNAMERAVRASTEAGMNAMGVGSARTAVGLARGGTIDPTRANIFGGVLSSKDRPQWIKNNIDILPIVGRDGKTYGHEYKMKSKPISVNIATDGEVSFEIDGRFTKARNGTPQEMQAGIDATANLVLELARKDPGRYFYFRGSGPKQEAIYSTLVRHARVSGLKGVKLDVPGDRPLFMLVPEDMPDGTVEGIIAWAAAARRQLPPGAKVEYFQGKRWIDPDDKEKYMTAK